MKLVSTLALAGIFAAAGVQAMDFSDMYVGVNVGRSTVAIPDNTATFTVTPATQSLSKSSSDTSYKVYGGAQVLDFLAVEAGYANLGSFSATRTTTGPAMTNTASGKTQGIYADGVGSYAINSTFSLLARLGYGYYWTSVENSVTGTTFPGGATSVNGKSVAQGFQYGLGAQFNMSKQIALRAEWDRKPSSYVISDQKVSIDSVSLGLLYKF